MAIVQKEVKSAAQMASEFSAQIEGCPVHVVQSEKKQKALEAIAEVVAAKREPKKPFFKKRKVNSIRLQEEVEEAFKANGVSISDKANELLTNYALEQGWL